MFDFIATPFGWLMKYMYMLIPDFGWCIIIFTIVVRLCMFPLQVKQQKNMAVSGDVMKKQKAIQEKYKNNKEKLNIELQRLYDQEHYNPMSSCLPMLITMVVLFGIIGVIYNPLQHILGLDGNAINEAVSFIQSSFQTNAPQISIIQEIQSNSHGLAETLAGYFGGMGSEAVQSIQDFNMNFLGFLNLGRIPEFGLNWYVIIPFIAGLSSFLVTFISMKMNPTQMAATGDQKSGQGCMKVTMYLMPLLSVVFAFWLPVGVALYWMISNFCSFGQSVLVKKLYPPEKVKAQAEAKKAKRKASGKKSRVEEALELKEKYTIKKTHGPYDNEHLEDLSQADKIKAARERMRQKYGDDQ